MILTAKYDGTCGGCNGHIYAGDPIDWEKGRKPLHIACINSTPKTDAPAGKVPAPVAKVEPKGPEVEVTLKKWLAHEKGCPVMLRGHILIDRPRAIYFKGHADLNMTHCCVCGMVLTNPLSVALGIGPVCGETYSIPPKLEDLTPDQLESYRSKVVDVEYEMWLPKSKIEIVEVVAGA